MTIIRNLTVTKLNRRAFLTAAAASTMTPYFITSSANADEKVPGFDQTNTQIDATSVWQPYTDRKLRVGLVGYGFCKFSAEFEFQNHPNVEIVAVSDLFPDRCAELAKAVKCEKTYPSLEEMVKDDSIEAIFCATDAPSHARHAILCLEHGKHVCHAVPVFYGDPSDADKLYETVKKNSGLKYAMFETSVFHDDVYAMEKIYKAGGFGRIVYSEGEYCHTKEPNAPSYPSYKDWRKNGFPLWYPTHATAYYVGVTHKAFTEVSAQPVYNRFPGADPNKLVGEIALLRTEEEGISRMMCCHCHGIYLEAGRVRGELGGFDATYRPVEEAFTGVSDAVKVVNSLGNSIKKPALPPGVAAGSHGGSHGYLCCDFVDAILKDQPTRVGIADALNMTMPGYYAHLSVLKDGETLKVPHYAQ